MGLVEIAVPAALLGVGLGLFKLWQQHKETVRRRGQLASERGWQYEENPEKHVSFRIRGVSDELSWRLEHRVSVRRENAELVWSCPDSAPPDIELVVVPEMAYKILGSMAGKLMLQVATSVSSSKLARLEVMRRRVAESRPVPVGTAVVLASDPELAQRVATGGLAQVVKGIPARLMSYGLTAMAHNGSIEIEVQQSIHKAEDIEAVIHVGLALARVLRSAREEASSGGMLPV